MSTARVREVLTNCRNPLTFSSARPELSDNMTSHSHFLNKVRAFGQEHREPYDSEHET